MNNSGIGFTGFLTLLFLGLKLTDVIDWSWWWVFAPLWIPVAIVFGVIAAIIAGLLVVGILAVITGTRL